MQQQQIDREAYFLWIEQPEIESLLQRVEQCPIYICHRQLLCRECIGDVVLVCVPTVDVTLAVCQAEW